MANIFKYCRHSFRQSYRKYQPQLRRRTILNTFDHSAKYFCSVFIRDESLLYRISEDHKLQLLVGTEKDTSKYLFSPYSFLRTRFPGINTFMLGSFLPGHLPMFCVLCDNRAPQYEKAVSRLAIAVFRQMNLARMYAATARRKQAKQTRPHVDIMRPCQSGPNKNRRGRREMS